MHSRTGRFVATTAALFLILNLVARPGVGPRMPPKPPGFELERYFGWPATYRAESWESDDPGMASRSKGSYRLYDPSREMKSLAREFGPVAVAIDVLFVATMLIMTVVGCEGSRRREWRRRDVAAIIACVAMLAALYLASDSASVSL